MSRYDHYLLLTIVAVLLGPASHLFAAHGDKPNIVVILADDLGYGDPHCYNPLRGRILTPPFFRLPLSKPYQP